MSLAEIFAAMLSGKLTAEEAAEKMREVYCGKAEPPKEEG